MAAKEKEYQRLPGRGMRRHAVVSATRSRLWLGKDHLLSTDAQWYSEEYKRFYFRDIQAVIIRKTDTGTIINLVFTTLTLLPLIAAIATVGEMSIFWWCVAGFFGFILLANTLGGPTCVSHMRTAVQTEELPSLRRLRRANKVLARLRPLIAAAQGELPPAEISARMEQLISHGSAAVFEAAHPAASPIAVAPATAAIAEPVAEPVADAAPQTPPEAPQAG